MFSGKTYNHFAIAQSHAAEVTKQISMFHTCSMLTDSSLPVAQLCSP